MEVVDLGFGTDRLRIPGRGRGAWGADRPDARHAARSRQAGNFEPAPGTAPEPGRPGGEYANPISPVAIGTIIAAVAVLLIHVLRPAAAIMKLPTTRVWRAPTSSTRRSAILRCRSQRRIAWAMQKPPSIRNTTSLA